MGVVISNTADNKIYIDGTGGITISSIISGGNDLSLNGSGAGALTLSGVNTFGGAGKKFTLASGTLNINNASALGSVSNTFVLNGGTINNTSGNAITISNYAQTWGGDFTFTGANALNLGTGAVTLGANRQVTVSGSTLTVGGAIGESAAGYGLTKTGAGTLALTGTTSTYTGATSLNGGILSFAGVGSLGTGGAINFGGGTLLYGSGNTADISARTVTFNSGGGSIDTGANNVTYASAIGNSGTGALTKLGSGSLTLNGTNSYAGLTTVSAGTLILAPGAVIDSATVSAAGTILGGSGTITNSLTVGGGGSVSLGTAATTGLLSVGSATLNGGGSYLWNLLDTGAAPGTGFDQISVGGGTGTVTVGSTSGSQFTINLNSAGATPTGWSSGTAYDFDIIDSGTLTGFASNKFSINTAGFTPAFTGFWSLADSSGNLRLSYTPGVSDLIIDVPSGTQTQTEAGFATIPTSRNLIKTGAGELRLTESTNAYTGTTAVNAGQLTVSVNAPNAAAGALGNSSTAVLIGDTSGSAEAALNIDTDGVTVDRGLSVRAGSSGTKTISGTNSSGTVTYSGNTALADNVTLSAVTGGTVAITGPISGTNFGITKTGNGTVSLSGGNSYTGPTAVNVGTLATTGADKIADTSAVTVGASAIFSLGGSETVASLAGAGSITYGGAYTLTVGGDNASTSFSGDLAGASGSLTKTGSGTLTLSGDNSFLGGGLTLSAGGLAIGSATASGTGTLALNGGTFQSSDATARSISNLLSFGGNVTIGAAASGNLTFGNAVNLGGAVRTLTTASDVTFSGAVTNGGITKLGSGILVLNGDATYAGGTTISAGTLQIGSGGTTGSIAGNIMNTATLVFNRSDDLSYGGNITGAGSLTKSGAGTLTLGGTNTYSLGSTVNAGGLTGTTASLQGAIVNNGGAVTFDQSTTGSYNGILSGSGSLVKLGSGVLTLGGLNTYLGGTTVTAGGLTGSTSSLKGAVTNNAAVAFTQNTDGTYSGNMGGSGSLTKTGTGTVTLSGSNSYSGGTTLSAGGLTGTTGSLQGNIANAGVLTFDQGTAGSYTGSLSGAGSLVKTGSGSVTLSGTSSSFSGPTTINSGTIVAGTGSALGTSAVTMNSGSLFGGAGVSTLNAITIGTAAGNTTGVIAGWDFNGLSAYGASPFAAATVASGISVGGLTRGPGVTTGGTAAGNAWGGDGWSTASTAASAFSTGDFVSFTLTATGASTLSVSSLNAYNVRRSGSGPTTGQWQYSVGGGAFQDLGSAITWGSTTTSAGNAQPLINTSAITGLQGVAAGTTITFRLANYNATTGTWYLNDPSASAGNDFSVSGAIPIAASGTGTIGIAEAGTTTFSGGVTVNNTATFSAVAGGIARFIGAGVSGPGAIFKTGAGEVDFGATNPYQGATTISEGILRLSGTGSLSQTSEVSISGGTLLVGSAAVSPISPAAPVKLGGALVTADSILRLGPDVTQVSTGSLTLLSTTSGARVIDYGGTSSSLTFGTIESGSASALQIWNWGGAGTLTVSSGLSGVSLSDITFYSGNGEEAGYLGIATFEGGGSSGNLVPVPEAGTLFGALGLLAPLAWRERRHWMRCRSARDLKGN